MAIFELATLAQSLARSRSDTVMISMNYNSYATLAIFFIIPVLFCFAFKLELYILYEC